MNKPTVLLKSNFSLKISTFVNFVKYTGKQFFWCSYKGCQSSPSFKIF